MVYSFNVQGKYLGTDFLFTKEMFEGLVGIDNIINFEEIIDIFSKQLGKTFPALRCEKFIYNLKQFYMYTISKSDC